MKQPPLRTPTDPCEHCGEPVGRFDWVVNGAGQLCHYPACFLAIYRAERTRAGDFSPAPASQNEDSDQVNQGREH